MTMRYRALGGTGIEVSVHCLAAMMFGAVGHPDQDECGRIIHAALDQGINFVDTADMYSAGESEDIGCSLPQLAVAFPLAHPAVTSVIIGPRTMRQLEELLKGAAVTLDDKTLDRIDDLVPPGSDLYRADGAWSPPVLADPVRRRRPLADRAAA